MRGEEIWDHEAAQGYDTPGTGIFAPEVLGPAVDRLAGLAGDGRALEFAIGTGRVAVPLARRGVPVTGIELSRPMIEQLRTKADETSIPVIAGDMATARAPGLYTLVYLVYNTISNLLTQSEQVACFRNAARHLTPGGRFVIELWVPQLRTLPPGQQALVCNSEPGYIGVDAYARSKAACAVSVVITGSNRGFIRRGRLGGCGCGRLWCRRGCGRWWCRRGAGRRSSPTGGSSAARWPSRCSAR